MSTTTKEIMEYLKGFPEDSKFGILAVSQGRRESTELDYR